MAAGDILRTQWFTPMSPSPGIGMVAAEGKAGDWSAYIGTYSMMDTDQDASARFIVERGASLDEPIALAVWPELADCGLKYRRGEG